MWKPVYLSLFLANTIYTVAFAHDRDFPTDETVRYAIGCMAELGGQTEENLYTCVCRINVLSEMLSYEEYDGGNMMERHKSMPGKKGGFFRDNKHGDELLVKLMQARETAFAQCPKVKRVQVKKN